MIYSNLFSYKAGNFKDAAEVEFLWQHNGKIIPIEVKSSKKSLRSKSLDSYVNKYSPKYAFKCYPGKLEITDKYILLPLYLIEKIFEIN